MVKYFGAVRFREFLTNEDWKTCIIDLMGLIGLILADEMPE